MSIQGNDHGFADPVAARAAVNRLKLRLALRRARSVLTAVEDSLDHHAEAMRRVRAVVADHGGALDAGVFKGAVSGLPIDLIERDNVREQQLLECVDLLAQVLDFLLKVPVHGAVPSSVCNDPDDIPDAAASHRLSEETSLT